jgi:hypothetical protein
MFRIDIFVENWIRFLSLGWPLEHTTRLRFIS